MANCWLEGWGDSLIIYMAAAENQIQSYKLGDFFADNHIPAFMTYYYPRTCTNSLKKVRETGNRNLVVIDSGAHSFFDRLGVSVVSRQTKKTENKTDLARIVPAYFERYLSWIEKHFPLIDFFVELDLQEVVGQEVIAGFRERLKTCGFFKKCITVHHSCNSWTDYERLLGEAQSGYVAIEGLRPNRPVLPYNKFIQRAYQEGVRIHGFAMTGLEILKKYPFYSVDSSSWTASIRYGSIPHYFGDKMGVALVGKNQRFVQTVRDPKLHRGRHTNEDSANKLKYGILQYKIFAEQMTKLWKARGVDWEKKIKEGKRG